MTWLLYELLYYYYLMIIANIDYLAVYIVLFEKIVFLFNPLWSYFFFGMLTGRFELNYFPKIISICLLIFLLLALHIFKKTRAFC